MSASLTASGARTDRTLSAQGAGLRLGRWRGWPACAPAAKIVGLGFVVLSAVLIAAGLVVTHLLNHSVGSWDDQVNAWFARNRTGAATWTTGYLTVAANAPAVIGVAVLATGVAALRRRAALAVMLVTGLAVELAAFLAANYAVGRPRPHVRHLGPTPSTYSWPSGHVGATFVLYAGIAVMVTLTTRRLFPRVLAWVFAASLTAAVALARIYRGDHHPTDAIAGLALGAGALLIATRAVRAWEARGRPEEPSVAPVGRRETPGAIGSAA